MSSMGSMFDDDDDDDDGDALSAAHAENSDKRSSSAKKDRKGDEQRKKKKEEKRKKRDASEAKARIGAIDDLPTAMVEEPDPEPIVIPRRGARAGRRSTQPSVVAVADPFDIPSDFDTPAPMDSKPAPVATAADTAAALGLDPSDFDDEDILDDIGIDTLGECSVEEPKHRTMTTR